MKHPATLYADWDEMVFADREQTFGAFDLRKNYPRHLLLSLTMGSMLFLSVTAGPLLWKRLFGAEELYTVTKVEVNPKIMPPPIADIPEEEIIVPPPSPTPPAPKVKIEGFQIPEPTPDAIDDTTSITSIELLNEVPQIGTSDQEGTDDIEALCFDCDGEGEIPHVVIESRDPGPGTFVHVEEEPAPINMDQLGITYPQIARDANIKGIVVMRILVDKKGNYKKHIVINAVHPLLTRAVEEKIGNLRFSPAIQGGRPIPFWVNIPFNFSLID
ncbi:MAG: energy transducer TonB [Bacteroidota bacterium]